MKKRNDDRWIALINSFLDRVSDFSRNAVDILENNESDDKAVTVDASSYSDKVAKEKVPLWLLVIRYIVSGLSFLLSASFLVLSMFFPLIFSTVFKGLSVGFLILSVVLFVSAENSRRLRNVIKTYLPLIGTRPEASISHLAHLLSVSVRQVKSDVKLLLRKGVFPDNAYYDKRLNILVLDGYAASDDIEVKGDKTSSDNILDPWISKLNSLRYDIINCEITEKLDIIIDYVSKISEYVKVHSERKKYLRTLVNYYLPTTVKLMQSYKTVEQMGEIGSNVAETKSRIESTMDALVSAYKKQLELIYSAEAMDIQGDIDVLEAMMKRNGVNDDK